MRRRWSIDHSRELYQLDGWSSGLFDISEEGHVLAITPEGPLDLQALTEDCLRRGIAMPLLVRLPGVLEQRIEALVAAFTDNMSASGYAGRFRGVYPIKVNQEKHLVEDLVAASRPFNLGMECGSKPELLVALALHDDPEALLVVNGYKDVELIYLAVGARQIGRNTVVVVEQPNELALVLAAGKHHGIAPGIGVRVKLGTTGSGRWSGSSGDRAKFGLTPHQLLGAIRELEAADALPHLELLHFHIGSQVTNIRAIREAVQEGARLFCELHRLGARPRYLDVGGGLGVDYDGSRTDFECSANYDVREYASVVIRTVKQVCDDAGVPHPDIVTECGRWMVAHSAVLVTSVLGTAQSHVSPKTALEVDAESVNTLSELLGNIDTKRPQSTYHAATAVRQDVLTRFVLANATLEERAAVDVLYRAICQRLVDLRPDEPLHEELAHLPKELADIYFCNFSLFQSAPDSWAVDQLFPIMPLSRLQERPTRQAILADLTCDSDGKIDRFIDERDVKDTLPLHDPAGAPYYLGMFLLGAYQETLGDLHNLFGDTHAVHVRATPDRPSGYVIEAVVEGETTQEVLGYLQYDRKDLIARVRAAVEDASSSGTLEIEAGHELLERYFAQMRAYTYLSTVRQPAAERRGAEPRPPVPAPTTPRATRR